MSWKFSCLSPDEGSQRNVPQNFGQNGLCRHQLHDSRKCNSSDLLLILLSGDAWYSFSLAYFDDIEWRNIYLGLVYFFCFCAFILFLVPKFDQPRFRVLRGSTFVICGLLSGLPLIHIEFYTNQQYLKDFISFPWGLGGFLYILGAVMYMLKVPERFKPGFFDIIVSDNNVLSLSL